MLNRLFFVNRIDFSKKTVKIILYMFLLVVYLLFLCNDTSVETTKIGKIIFDKKGGKFELPQKDHKLDRIKMKTYIPRDTRRMIIDSRKIFKSERFIKQEIVDEFCLFAEA